MSRETNLSFLLLLLLLLLFLFVIRKSVSFATLISSYLVEVVHVRLSVRSLLVTGRIDVTPVKNTKGSRRHRTSHGDRSARYPLRCFRLSEQSSETSNRFVNSDPMKVIPQQVFRLLVPENDWPDFRREETSDFLFFVPSLTHRCLIHFFYFSENISIIGRHIVRVVNIGA